MPGAVAQAPRRFRAVAGASPAPAGGVVGPASTPAVLAVNSFDGGAAGQTITTLNSGGASGQGFDAVSIGTGGAATYTALYAAHGPLASVWSSTTASQASAAWWTPTLGQAQTTVYFRCYVYLPQALVEPTRFFTALNVAQSSGCARYVILASGQVQLQNGFGGAVMTTATAIPPNQWVRVEGYALCHPTYGQGQIKIFLSPESLVPDETLTSAPFLYFRSAADEWIWGCGTQSIQQGPVVLDSVAATNTGYIGPVGLNVSPQTAMGNGICQRDMRQVARAQMDGTGRNAGGPYVFHVNAFTFMNSFEGAPLYSQLNVAGSASGGMQFDIIGITRYYQQSPVGASRVGMALQGGVRGVSGLSSARTRPVSAGVWRGGSVYHTGGMFWDSAQKMHGMQSLNISTPIPGNPNRTVQQFFGWAASVGPQVTVWFRLYGYFTDYPVARVNIFSVYAIYPGAIVDSYIVIGAQTGNVILQDQYGTPQLVGAPIPLDNWFRLEGFVTIHPSQGQIGYSLYLGDSAQPVATGATGAVPTRGVNPQWGNRSVYYEFGAVYTPYVSPSGEGPYWLDDVAVSNQGPIGPTYTVAPSQSQLGVVTPRTRQEITLAKAPLSVAGGVEPYTNTAPAIQPAPVVSVAPAGAVSVTIASVVTGGVPVTTTVTPSAPLTLQGAQPVTIAAVPPVGTP